jgi:hypothetical protein
MEFLLYNFIFNIMVYLYWKFEINIMNKSMQNIFETIVVVI